MVFRLQLDHSEGVAAVIRPTGPPASPKPTLWQPLPERGFQRARPVPVKQVSAGMLGQAQAIQKGLDIVQCLVDPLPAQVKGVGIGPHIHGARRPPLKGLRRCNSCRFWSVRKLNG